MHCILNVNKCDDQHQGKKVYKNKHICLNNNKTCTWKKSEKNLLQMNEFSLYNYGISH